jgi:rod shape-determining protein MreD
MPAKGNAVLRVAGSLVLALVLSMAGVRSWTQFLMPPLVLLVTLYWVLFGPALYGLGFAFLVGLLLDLMFGTPGGQYALAFCVTVYLAQLLEHRVRHFTIPYQCLVAGALTLVFQLIVVAFGQVLEGGTLRLAQFYSALGAMLVWPLLVFLLGRLHDRSW